MFIFFYKWKTAYGMRIGDWSSDACASDLAVKSVLAERGRIDGLVNNAGGQYPMPLAAISKKGWDAVVASNLTGGFLMARETYTQWKIGRASCRERVCQYVYISVLAVSSHKKDHKQHIGR